MPEFTKTQGRYLAYIHAYTEGFGLSPAESEIAEAIGVSAPSVNQMVKTLERKELIAREPGVPRSIKILVPYDEIPKWSGKAITRTVRQWTYVGPSPSRSTKTLAKAAANNKPQASTKAIDIYVLKITLRETKPPIWRRIETPNVSLADLHEQIQTAMGWTNSHMHQFRIGHDCYVDPRALDYDCDWAESYEGITLADLRARSRGKLVMNYEYDFGDGWEHQVTLEKVVRADPSVRYPRCSAGKLACPPEDIGGVWGFYDFLEAINDPNHPEHEDRLEWVGPFDPDEFDKDEVTRYLQKI